MADEKRNFPREKQSFPLMNKCGVQVFSCIDFREIAPYIHFCIDDESRGETQGQPPPNVPGTPAERPTDA